MVEAITLDQRDVGPIIARLRAAEAELKSIRDYMESFHEVETLEDPCGVLAKVHERITKTIGSSNDAT